MTRDGAKTVLLVGLVGAGLVLLTNRAAAARKVATSGGSTVPVTPPVTVPTPIPTPTPAPKPPTSPAPPAVKPGHSALVDLVQQAIYKELPQRRLSPLATRELAVNLVGVCERQAYPLDLAFGHAYAESNLQLLAHNSSSGATGPLQVTAIAAQEVGTPWPIESHVIQLEAGVRYMKYLRAKFPECAGSVRETLRTYGMGRGNWLKYKAGELGCDSSVSVVRAELGCTGNRPYSATVIAMAQRHPELKTTAWWGSNP
ncbi:lytic transglycosylase domain-containing protein [Deinococcus sp. KSM4-11]|uniref:lytic transglycosylase domain-containing protein n=1 Tax=Deinococcus sp. KSM4-11 TaxID=2568654 RepID=UPI0010A5809E|nr:lytic transglycosylase domain-containing protein [Deinococcus sp. KSM4-11]THF88456.1 lytic transglycosylase domain-containing protein [Deinococcus sp. KSM4-11]